MAIVNPEHLFEQADALIQLAAAGPPRQANLRRAISTAYYGLFHATLRAAADLFAGATNRNEGHYALIYRGIDHKSLRDLCEEVIKTTLPKKYIPYVPTNGFGPNIVAYATAIVELQNKRIAADYDPLFRVTKSDAELLIRTGRAAVARFQKASNARRRAFLTLVAFPPRPAR